MKKSIVWVLTAIGVLLAAAIIVIAVENHAYNKAQQIVFAGGFLITEGKYDEGLALCKTSEYPQSCYWMVIEEKISKGELIERSFCEQVPDQVNSPWWAPLFGTNKRDVLEANRLMKDKCFSHAS